jgi:siroheme synthase-like protein
MSKRYYPLNFDVTGKKCLVVGGGAVGERKVKSLLACGATVELVSIKLTAVLERLAGEGRIKVFRRGFEENDIEGAFLVYCATDDSELNRRVFETADKKSLPVNVVDQPSLCNFIVPAVVRKGPLLASVSTSAAAPALAKKLKKILSAAFDEGYAPLLEFLAEKRKIIKAEVDDMALRKKIFDALIESPLEVLFTSGEALPKELPEDSDFNFDFGDYKKKNAAIIENAENIYINIRRKFTRGGDDLRQ